MIKSVGVRIELSTPYLTRDKIHKASLKLKILLIFSWSLLKQITDSDRIHNAMQLGCCEAFHGTDSPILWWDDKFLPNKDMKYQPIPHSISVGAFFSSPLFTGYLSRVEYDKQGREAFYLGESDILLCYSTLMLMLMWRGKERLVGFGCHLIYYEIYSAFFGWRGRRKIPTFPLVAGDGKFLHKLLRKSTNYQD